MKRGLVVTGAVLLAIAGSLGYCQLRVTQLGAAFDVVKVGDAEPDVVAKMGRPHQVLEGCGYYGQQIAGCARQYVYSPPWTIVGEAWTVSLNASGLVIQTAHYVSP